jgi:hypothetical protein
VTFSDSENHKGKYHNKQKSPREFKAQREKIRRKTHCLEKDFQTKMMGLIFDPL